VGTSSAIPRGLYVYLLFLQEQIKGIIIVLGSAHETRDLVRAGVHTLSRAVILSSNEDNGENDSDSLFTYQSIAKVRPGVSIVCEIDDGDNVSFLCKEEGERDDDFTMSFHHALCGRRDLRQFINRRNPPEPIVLVHYGPWHLFFALFLEMVISGYR
jgi:hypothetical protein